MMNVLILCTGNSCRSQMAEGYFRKYVNEITNVFSAGIEAHGLNPDAVIAMMEDGIDISNHSSKLIEDLPYKDFEVVITVCDNAKESCPVFPAKSVMIHQDFEDPAKFDGPEDKKIEKFREVRDEIKTFAKTLVENNFDLNLTDS